MLRLSRLRRRSEFRRVYARGIKAAGTYLTVFLLLAEPGEVRLGITATRKFGKAVKRNRARRRVRALYRAHAEALWMGGGDLVVNVRRGCAEAAWAELEEDWVRCLGRLRRKASASES